MKHLNTSFINNYDRQFLFNQQLHNKRNICTKSAAFDFRTVYTGVIHTMVFTNIGGYGNNFWD